MSESNYSIENFNPLDKYRTSHLTYIDASDFGCSVGRITVEVLPELKDHKVDMVVISLLQALGATCVRITTGECTTDSPMGVRATITVDEDDYIKKIEIEPHFVSPTNSLVCNGSDLKDRLKGLKRPETTPADS